jgi:parvulin-like peptidyl-prolyl isomerase
VHYAGAQGVSPKARSKEEAARLAASLAEKGREDFAEAVKEGDEGSAKKAGKMYRGILEPSVEQAVFKLGKGEVSEPIDTPRGFWVVKRLK